MLYVFYYIITNMYVSIDGLKILNCLELLCITVEIKYRSLFVRVTSEYDRNHHDFKFVRVVR